VSRWSKPALRLALLVVSLAIWEAAVRLLRIPAFILPPPSHVGAALYRGAVSGIYLENFWITLAETLLGFALGSLVAFVVGTALAASRLVEYYLYPYIVMFQ
jgi:NitT/TauT family transport system permease protein